MMNQHHSSGAWLLRDASQVGSATCNCEACRDPGGVMVHWLARVSDGEMMVIIMSIMIVIMMVTSYHDGYDCIMIIVVSMTVK